MTCKRLILLAAMLMVMSLVIVGCASAPTPPVEEQSEDHEISPLSPLSQISPLQVEVEALVPVSGLAPASEPLQLIVLHTNDNWGETEPCG
jgi:hypothetical protein